jgi:hypothetical protein
MRTSSVRVEPTVVSFTTPMNGSAHAVLVGENNGQPVFDIHITQPGNDPLPDQQAITGWYALRAFALARGWTETPTTT